jgi:hypothetical protein
MIRPHGDHFLRPSSLSCRPKHSQHLNRSCELRVVLFGWEAIRLVEEADSRSDSQRRAGCWMHTTSSKPW